MKTKVSKFYEMFKEPCRFFEGELAVSAEHYTKEEAFELFKKHENFKGSIEEIEEEWVKHRGSYFEDQWTMAWWSGSKGMKGAKKIWIIY